MNRLFLYTVIMAMFGSIGSGLLYTVDESGFLSLASSQLLLVLPTVLYICRWRIPVKDFLRIGRLPILNILLLVLFSFSIIPFLNFLNVFSMLFARNVIGNTASQIIGNQSLAVSLFVIAFLPGAMEEAVYRGAFYNEYRKVSLRKGLLLSALLFALMHLNLNQFIYAFAMGLIFPLLVEANNSILASLLVHFIINANSVISVFRNQEAGNGGGAYTASELVGYMRAFAVPMIMSLFISIGLLAYMAKNTGRLEQIKDIFREEKKEEKEKEKDSSLATVSLLVGIGICTFLIVWGEMV